VAALLPGCMQPLTGEALCGFAIGCRGSVGQLEWGVAALLKAVWWDLRLASLLTHLLSHHTVVWGILSLLCV